MPSHAKWGGDLVSNTIKVEVADPRGEPGDDTGGWIRDSGQRRRERNERQKDHAARGGPPRVDAPKIDAYAAGRKAIEMFDANRDAVVSGKELDKCPGLKAACTPGTSAPPTLDPARTGRISAEMTTNRIKIGRPTGSAGCRCVAR